MVFLFYLFVLLCCLRVRWWWGRRLLGRRGWRIRVGHVDAVWVVWVVVGIAACVGLCLFCSYRKQTLTKKVRCQQYYAHQQLLLSSLPLPDSVPDLKDLNFLIHLRLPIVNFINRTQTSNRCC